MPKVGKLANPQSPFLHSNVSLRAVTLSKIAEQCSNGASRDGHTQDVCAPNACMHAFDKRKQGASGDNGARRAFNMSKRYGKMAQKRHVLAYTSETHIAAVLDRCAQQTCLAMYPEP